MSVACLSSKTRIGLNGSVQHSASSRIDHANSPIKASHLTDRTYSFVLRVRQNNRRDTFNEAGQQSALFVMEQKSDATH